jgi:hypothetical protein
VGRRISTVAFGFDDPQAMTGTFGDTLATTIMMGYQDALNPFKHKYHPDHDNLDARFESVLPSGKESFDIERSLSFTFTDEDPEGLPELGWGDSVRGGTFQEIIIGVHRRPLHVGGFFRIIRVSDIGTLSNL